MVRLTFTFHLLDYMRLQGKSGGDGRQGAQESHGHTARSLEAPAPDKSVARTSQPTRSSHALTQPPVPPHSRAPDPTPWGLLPSDKKFMQWTEQKVYVTSLDSKTNTKHWLHKLFFRMSWPWTGLLSGRKKSLCNPTQRAPHDKKYAPPTDSPKAGATRAAHLAG